DLGAKQAQPHRLADVIVRPVDGECALDCGKGFLHWINLPVKIPMKSRKAPTSLRSASVAHPPTGGMPATAALPGHIRLARPPSTRKKSFLSGTHCGARSADPFAMKHIKARRDDDRRSHQRIGVRHIAEYRIAERDDPDELTVDE